MTSGPGQAVAFGFEGTAIPDDLAAAGPALGPRRHHPVHPQLSEPRDRPGADGRRAPARSRTSWSWSTTRADGFTGCPLRSPDFRPRRPSAAPAIRAWPRPSREPWPASSAPPGSTPVWRRCSTVCVDSSSAVIGDRAFATAPDDVAVRGAAFVEAMLGEGLLPVAKHFPGHGRASADSHHELPEIDVICGRPGRRRARSVPGGARCRLSGGPDRPRAISRPRSARFPRHSRPRSSADCSGSVSASPVSCSATISRWPPSPPPGVSPRPRAGFWPRAAISPSCAGGPTSGPRRWRRSVATSTGARSTSPRRSVAVRRPGVSSTGAGRVPTPR